MPSAHAARRHGPTRISIYNHKGGVGKTTLTMNLAATLADNGSRVLLIDSDPQCNLTSYLLDDDAVDELLDRSDSDRGRTIWSAVRPLSEAVGGLKVVKPVRTGVENLFLVPGDIRLSEFETDLAEFWAQCLQRKPKGFRGTSAISELVGEIARQLDIDYVFYDSGPNIGPLNRAILLDCTCFIIPVSCDLFSLRALKTLGRTLSPWITDWSTISDLAPEDMYLLPGKPRFLGYVPGGFRVYGGAVAQQHSHYLSRIEKEIHAQIVALLRKIDPDLAPGTLSQFKLGELKDFGSLVPASQRDGLPLYAVTAGTNEQRAQARQALTALAHKVEARSRSGIMPPRRIRMTAADRRVIEPLLATYASQTSQLELFRDQLMPALFGSASLTAHINSIRSRMKDPDNLRDTLLRKLHEAKERRRPFGITPETLLRRINDLVGVRILHLHTRQILPIDSALRGVFAESKFQLIEGPFARTWDDESRAFFRECGITSQKSPSMYTSVHYVIGSASRTRMTAEIQVRTLMEEVWGEVDHTMNYPAKSESLPCVEQLKVLARVTSSASRLVDSIFVTLEDHYRNRGGPRRRN